ncbi:MAG TPA: hypothetical protein DIC60_01150 [Lachnospiraceae bacterium]|nr:hypothetical protein [Lachnospiraceae bacterium]
MIKVDIYDTKFSIDRGENPNMWEHEGNVHWDNFADTMSFLGSIGFYVGEDKRIKKQYPILLKDHKEGRYADLKFKAEWHPNVFYIEFYQDVSYENPNGGYYDFNKRKKMPYLIGKQYDITQKKLVQFFKSKGFSIEFRPNSKKGKDFIIEDYIRSCHRPQKQWFDLAEIEGETSEYSYNNQDRDKKTIYNGDIKYFRDWSGYLMRGKVYHNINNMWWVLLPCGTVNNVAGFALFDRSPADVLGRLKRHNPPKEYVERKKQLSLCNEKELINELKRRRKCC